MTHKTLFKLMLLTSLEILTFACKKDISENEWNTYKTFNGIYGYNFITSIAIDSLGNKWFGTLGGGVTKFDGTTWTSYYTKDGLVSNNVTAIGIDKKNNKWFCTIGAGISKFDDANWTTYNTSNGLVNDSVWAFAIDARGNKWVGYKFNVGLSEFNDNTWTTYDTLYQIINNQIIVNQATETCALGADSQGNVWVGLNSNGIWRFDGTNWTRYGNIMVIPNAITSDFKCNVWVGGFEGVAKFNGTDWTPFYQTATTLLNGAWINSVAADGNGNVWFGVNNLGVLKFDGSNWTTYNIHNGLISNLVQSLKIDAQNNVWVGTQIGISELLSN